MSLHKFAEQVASQGRGDDSLLVHMTPDEVRNLQQFAQANGTTLTINPTTGLPEAGLLSDLFKAVAPLALGAFLGPGAFGITGMGLSAGMAGAVTGGITTLATGSLSRGLMAGLGAYGGAGLAEGFMGAGAGAAQQSAMGALTQDQIAAQMAESGLTQQGVLNQAAADATKSAMANTGQAVSSGFKAATATPAAMGAFAKQNLGNLAYAAAPIAAGLMVPTTTKLPDPTNTGLIRQMAYNINPDTGMPDPLYGKREMTPIKASEFGDKTFKGQRDLFYQQNPNPYQNPYELGVGSLNQPPLQQPARMNTGGIVALAGGGTGVPTYFVENPDVAKAYTENTYGLTPEQFAYTHAEKFGNAEAASGQRAPTTQSAGAAYAATHGIDLQKNINDWIVNNPFATAADVTNALAGSGLTQADVNPYLTANTNISDAARYSLSHLDEIDGLSGMQKNILTALGRNPNMTQSEIDAAQAQYKISDYDIQSPLIHGYQVANDQTAAAQAYLADPKNADVLAWINSKEGDDYLKANPQFDLNDIAYTHFQRYGEDEGRKWGVTTPVVKPPVVTSPVVNLPAGVTPTGYYGSGPATGVDYSGNTVSIATPGDIVRNADGTSTVVPNIPGRPAGGFTGIEQLKSAYTAGGGSLGYTSPVVKTPAEHEAAYNKLTDDSLDAYNFLMGKGKNLTQRTATASRPVMRRYDEAVLGRKMTRPVKTTATTKSVTGVPGQPQTYFNEAEYLAANPDVAAELKSGKANFTSGYEHYLRNGKAEGRPFTGDYEGYLTAAALADAANSGGGGGDGPTGPAPAPDASSPANDAPGTTTAKDGGMIGYAMGGGLGSLGSYSDGGRLLKGPGDGVSDSIPATIGRKRQPARLADGEFVIPARIVSELGNGSTDAGAKKLYAMMDRVQRARGKTTGKNKVAANSRADKYLPA